MTSEHNILPPTQIPFDDQIVTGFFDVPEGYTFDCKRLGKLDRVLETVVAFANAEGGIIALGLEDPEKAKGRDRVYGVQENALALDDLRKLVRSRITPEVAGLVFSEIGCTLRSGQAGSVCFLRVPKSPGVHSIVNGGTFFLINEQINKCVLLKAAIPYPFDSNSLYPLSQRCEQLLDKSIREAKYLLQYIDGSSDEEVYRHIYREFKTVVRDIEYYEMYGIAVLKLEAPETEFINKLLNKIHRESNIPLPIATLANFSDKYFFYAPVIDVVFIPLLQHKFLLHLADLYHELGHYVTNKYDEPKLANVKQTYHACLARITNHYGQQIKKKMFEKSGKTYAEILLSMHDSWKASWFEEMYCDAFATYLTGPAYVWAHLHLMMKLDEEPYYFDLNYFKEHPSNEARLRFMCHCLRQIGLDQDADKILAFWSSLQFLNNDKGNEYYYQAFPDTLFEALVKLILEGLQKDRLTIYSNAVSDKLCFVRILNDAWENLWQSPNHYIEHEKQKIAEIECIL